MLNVTLEQAAPGSLELHDVRNEELLPSQLEDENAIHKIVSDYYEAFVRDPVVAADYYGEPSLIVLPQEVKSLPLPRRADIVNFLANSSAALLARGYLNTRMQASRVRKLNQSTALYGTVAARMKTDGTELERAAFTCLLHKGDSGWTIRELVATDVDSLLG
jgi:hypothetical protein